MRTGFTQASGDVIAIQDADPEYDPGDWSQILELIIDRKVADIAYGSRFYGRPSLAPFYHYMRN